MDNYIEQTRLYETCFVFSVVGFFRKLQLIGEAETLQRLFRATCSDLWPKFSEFNQNTFMNVIRLLKS